MATLATSQPLMQQPYTTAQINALPAHERSHGSLHAQAFSNRADLLRPGQGEASGSRSRLPLKPVKKAQPTPKPSDTDLLPTQQELPLSPTQGSDGQLVRASAESSPRRRQPHVPIIAPEESNWEVRHGFEDQYSSHQYLELLNSVSRIWIA